MRLRRPVGVRRLASSSRFTADGPETRGIPFGRAAEEPYQRRPSDLVRLGGAVLLVAGLAAQATHVLGTTQLNIYQLFSSLPRGLTPQFRVLERVGTLWAVGLVGAAALVGRRWRLARDLLLAGWLAWAISRVLGSEVVGHVGFHASLRTLSHAGPTPGFPQVRLSVVAAVVATASPYVGRPTRRFGQGLVAVLALGGMYVGIAYPDDLLGAVILGWGVASAVHLLFGSPGGRPSTHQIRATLVQVGIEATSVRLSTHQGPDGVLFEVEDPGGRLEAKVIGRDALDAQLLAKTWRFVASKEPTPPFQLTRVQQVEHEAFMTVLAGAAGVRAPKVLFAGRAGPGAAVLVIRHVEGRRLDEAVPDEITDEVLAGAWDQMAKLHAAGIAHGSFQASHVVVSQRSLGITSFATASMTTAEGRQARDVAELLAATAAVVGDERAVTVGIATRPASVFEAALPFLQPAALGRPTRAALGGHHSEVRSRLDGIRSLTAEMLGVEPPSLRQLQRFQISSVLLVLSSLVAVAVLLDQVGDPTRVWAIVGHAGWGWLSAALLVSLATNIPYAVALMGTVTIRLPLWPTSELQLAMSYSNLVIPVIGGTGFQIRFLQRQGADLTTAVAAGGLLSVAGTVITQLPLFVLAVWLSPTGLHFGRIPVSGLLEVVSAAVVAIGVVTAIAFGIPRLRLAVLPPTRKAATTIWVALRSRRQLALIIGGNVVVSILYGCCLLFCLEAFGAYVSFWTVLAISIGVGNLATLIPIPGGSVAAGAVGLTAVLVGLGLPAQVAVAATLANQLTVTYIPALPGWLATRQLLRREYL